MVSGLKLELLRVNLVNNMAGDATAPCVARSSATMILTVHDAQVVVSFMKDFNGKRHIRVAKWFMKFFVLAWVALNPTSMDK